MTNFILISHWSEVSMVCWSLIWMLLLVINVLGLKPRQTANNTLFKCTNFSISGWSVPSYKWWWCSIPRPLKSTWMRPSQRTEGDVRKDLGLDTWRLIIIRYTYLSFQSKPTKVSADPLLTRPMHTFAAKSTNEWLYELIFMNQLSYLRLCRCTYCGEQMRMTHKTFYQTVLNPWTWASQT